MTPQRQAYLAKCGKREKVLRDLIIKAKALIRACKKSLNADGEPCFFKDLIREAKFELNAYRHEIARLKGMDRVVRAKEFQEVGSQGLSRCSKCGEDLSINERFCSACGRKILWEKVKQ